MCLSSERSATSRLSRTFSFFHLPQPAEFVHAQMRVFLFPGVGGLFSNPELPADIPNRRPTLGLPNGIHDVFFGES